MRIREVVCKVPKPIRYLVVGGTGAGIQLGLLAFFTEIAGVWYIASAAIGIIVATFWNYTAHNYYTYRNKKWLK